MQDYSSNCLIHNLIPSLCGSHLRVTERIATILASAFHLRRDTLDLPSSRSTDKPQTAPIPLHSLKPLRHMPAKAQTAVGRSQAISMSRRKYDDHDLRSEASTEHVFANARPRLDSLSKLHPSPQLLATSMCHLEVHSIYSFHTLSSVVDPPLLRVIVLLARLCRVSYAQLHANVLLVYRI